MKALKIVGFILGGIVVLVAMLTAVAFVPAVQTWAVRKAVAGQPGMKIEIGAVAAGLTTTEIRDLRLVQDGLVLTAKRIFARYSTWDYLKHKRITVDDVEVQGLGVDARQLPATASATTAPAPTRPAAASTPRPPVFLGVLRMAQLPMDVRLGALAMDGRAMLPGGRAVDFTVKGGDLEVGRRGQFTWKVDFSDPAPAAPLRALHANGTLGLHIATDRRIDLIEIENTATAEGPKLPPDALRLELKAEQASPEANEIYATGISLVRSGKPESIFNTRVEYLTGAHKLEGTWSVAMHTEQIAALLSGLGLPEASAEGAGKFSFQPDTTAAVASGELKVEVAGLEKLGPQFAAVGPLQLHAAFDGAFADDIARLNQLEIGFGTAAGRKLLQVRTAQPVSFNLGTKRFIFGRPNAELAQIVLQGLPLAWAQSAAKPWTIDGGDLSAAFSIKAEADGSQVHLIPVQPVTIAGVTVRDGNRKLVEQLGLTLSPTVDYSATKISVNVPDLNLSQPAGDAVAGNFKVEVTNLPASPVISFAARLQERLVSVLRPFLPFDPGPIMIESATEGRLQGQSLQLGRFTTSVKLKDGTLLASAETLQPLTADFATVRVAAADAATAAVRMRLGQFPLALAEQFLAKSKLAGTLNGATVDISLPAADQVVMQTTAPLSVRGFGLVMDGQALAKDLDLDVDFTAAKRGETMSAEVRRVEVRQGPTVLAKLTAAGETTQGAKLNASGKGRIEVDLAAVMKQPALATAMALSRGNLAGDFEVVSGDPLQLKGKVTLRNLVARQGNQSLGDFDCQVDGAVKADGSAGSVKIPLTLTVGGRRSDLTVDGSFSRAASALSFTGKLASSQIVADDFMALAALAPQNPASNAPAGSKPPDANPAPAKPLPGGAGVASPAAAQGAAVPAARDADPFWKGIGGRIDADLKSVKYGRDTIADIRCAAVIGESRLALDNLEGKFQDDPFKIAAGIAFSAKDPHPYTLTGAVKIPGFDVGAFLRFTNPKEAPALETKVTIDATLNGRGATLPDLAQNAYGQIDVTGSKGILRALGNKGQIAGAASSVLGLFGAITGSGTSVAVGQLAGELKEMPFDHFFMHVNRGADLNLKLTSLEFLSAATRLTGSGTIQYRKGVSIADQPLHVEMQLAGKEHMAVLLGNVYLLGDKKDDKGYALMNSPFVIGGTPANPDSSQLWKIVGSAAAAAAAPAAAKALGGLFGR